MKKLWLLLILCIVGCTPNPESLVGKTPPKAVWSDSRQSESSDVVAIEKAMELVSKDDCEVLYYLLSGIAEYTDKYTGITKLEQVNRIYRNVKERFGKQDGWLDIPGPNNDISDFIEQKTTEAGFNKPGEFTEDSKKAFVKIYRDTAEVVLKVYKGKK
jgi:hypothetical protein